MRLVLLAAVSALALAACSKPTESASGAGAADTVAAAPAADAPAAEAHTGHDMAAMDSTMAASDTADDANTAETPEGHTFHTFPNKAESIHLPVAAGEVWTAKASDAALVAVGEAADAAMPDGVTHHVVKVTPLASGNATVTFERRLSADAAAAPTATRTVNFMIH